MMLYYILGLVTALLMFFMCGLSFYFGYKYGQQGVKLPTVEKETEQVIRQRTEKEKAMNDVLNYDVTKAQQYYRKG